MTRAVSFENINKNTVAKQTTQFPATHVVGPI
jgi:hypothetical protein